MLTQIQMHNNRALDTGAEFKKIISERLPHGILKQMHTIDLSGKTNTEIVEIITRAGRMVKQWNTAPQSLGLKASLREKTDKYWTRFKQKTKLHANE